MQDGDSKRVENSEVNKTEFMASKKASMTTYS